MIDVCRNLSRRRREEEVGPRSKPCQRQRVEMWRGNQSQNDDIFKEVKGKEEVKNVTEWKASK
jgi:hypothetical protein